MKPYRMVFDVIRHGQKDGDKLTELGIHQVHATAQQHLAGTKYDMVYYSGLNRAEQTAKLALVAINHPILPTIKNEGFGFEWLEKDPAMPQFDFNACTAELTKRIGEGVHPTVWDWFHHWPVFWGLRGRLLETMINISNFAAVMNANGDKTEFHFLAGSHGPTAEAAVLDPKAFPALRMADGVRYTFERENNRLFLSDIKMVSSEFLPCPMYDK